MQEFTDQQGEEASSEPNAPKEASPWVLAYIDSSKIGDAMLISRFASNTLDTLSPKVGDSGNLNLGSISTNDSKATTSVNYIDILDSIKMSPETAETFGAIDDVSLRYINPDINNDGKLDAPVLSKDGILQGESKKFILGWDASTCAPESATVSDNEDHQGARAVASNR